MSLFKLITVSKARTINTFRWNDAFNDESLLGNMLKAQNDVFESKIPYIKCGAATRDQIDMMVRREMSLLCWFCHRVLASHIGEPGLFDADLHLEIPGNSVEIEDLVQKYLIPTEQPLCSVAGGLRLIPRRRESHKTMWKRF